MMFIIVKTDNLSDFHCFFMLKIKFKGILLVIFLLFGAIPGIFGTKIGGHVIKILKKKFRKILPNKF